MTEYDPLCTERAEYVSEYAGIGESDAVFFDDVSYDAITATDDAPDLPDDLPSNIEAEEDAADALFEGKRELLGVEERSRDFLGETNPWEGLDEWAANFDLRTLPVVIGSDWFKHAYAGLDLDEPSAEAWQSTLEECYAATGVVFEGDMARAAICMAAFERGVQYVHEKFGEKGVVVEPPPVKIVTDPDLPESEPYLGASARDIVVNGPALEDASLIAEDEVLAVPNPDSGEPPGMVGRIEELFLLIGVEEAHHHIHETLAPPAGPQARNLSHIEYHAQEREFHALRWKIMAAKTFGLPDRMVTALQYTYDAAKQLRSNARKD